MLWAGSARHGTSLKAALFLASDAAAFISGTHLVQYMAHKPKPTKTEPGVMYMLAGGTDWSATDPFGTSGTPIKEPPHWMIMWPFDPKSSGLSGLPTTPKQTGAWIMYA
jgi:hypothetical protein